MLCFEKKQYNVLHIINRIYCSLKIDSKLLLYETRTSSVRFINVHIPRDFVILVFRPFSIKRETFFNTNVVLTIV